MIISGKHTGIILIIVTLCLLVVVILFNYGSIDYKMVQAKIVEAGSEIDNRNTESVIFNRYLFPFLLIIIVVDILYIRSKFFK